MSVIRLLPCATMLLLLGCAKPEGIQISRVLATPHTAPAAPAEHPVQATPIAPAPASAVAVVNGRALDQQRFSTMLVDSHGLFVLEQMISLNLAQAAAEQAGLRITDEDVQSEFDRSLIEMAHSAAPQAPRHQQLDIGRQLLDEFLRDKRVSMAEYMNGMRRNACLRQLSSPRAEVSEADVDTLYGERFGRTARARHIELGSPAAARAIRQQLAAGTAFPQLARTHSENRATAPQGGLLPPFTATDPRVPAALRDAVFAMEPGEISALVRVEDRHHLVLLESFDDNPAPPLTPALAMDLRRELLEARQREAMQQLERELFEAADIRIEDPVLGQRFREKYRTR